LIAFASSLDQIGPMTRSVRDAAVTLNVIAGRDSSDATTVGADVPDFTAALTGDIRGARIGVPRALVGDGVDPEVAQAFNSAMQAMAARGATIVDIELPHASKAIAVYYLVATAEASSNLARFDGVRSGFRAKADGPAKAAHHQSLQEMYTRTREEGFGPEVKRRIMLGTYVLSAGYYDAYYLKAQQVRTLILRDYDRAFERVDVVAMPTTPTPAFTIGERVDDPLQMYLGDIFTVSANLAGLPAISIPCGFTKPVAPTPGASATGGGGGLPVGLQLTGRRFDEATLLRIADAYERDTEWSKQAPPIANR
jgi:aspartyl-tRNA(Asn)/glutamyl-tRNA(Gln) amidotransferase subunit A